MLRIRFSRIGKKKAPIYRITIAERARDTYGKALEILGTYNPGSKELLNIKKERIEYWLSKGAQMSPSVNNLLVEKEVVKGEKVTASKSGKKKGEEEAKQESAKTEEKQAEAPKEEKAEEKENKENSENKE